MKIKSAVVSLLISISIMPGAQARYYDPGAGRFISPDPIVPNAQDPQTLNRYSYVRNNPLIYNDPSGHIAALAIGIGATLGAYSGYNLAQSKGYNFSDWQTYAYINAGAGIGGASGAIGSSVAGMSIPFANTAGIIAGSSMYSTSMSVLSSGAIDPQVGYGFGSYNLMNGKNDMLFDGNNEWYVDAAYSFGALANLQDVGAGLNGTTVNVNASPIKGENGEWMSHTSITNKDKNINISVGPAEGNGKFGYLSLRPGNGNWSNYVNMKGRWTVRLNNIRSNTLQYASNRFKNAKGLLFNDLKWNAIGCSCVNHASRSLWLSGAPTLPINFHPYVLNSQLTIREVGIYANPYINSNID